MKQRVPARTWYSSSERRRPRLLIEDDHPALEISDFTAFRHAGFDVAFCSGPGVTPGSCPLLCGADCEVLAQADVVLHGLGPETGLVAGIRWWHPEVPVIVKAGGPGWRVRVRSGLLLGPGAGGRRAAGPREGRRERGRGRRLDRDSDLAGQAVAAGQPQVVAAPEAAGVVPARAVAA